MTQMSGIEAVMRAFDASDWQEVHLVTGDVEVHLVAGEAAAASHLALNEAAQTSHVHSGEMESQKAPASTAATERPVSTEAATPDDEGLEIVRAATPGIFWRAPSPGAPPFVEAGRTVEAGATMCIVEVMKLMGTVCAPMGGVVEQICVENGQPVETGAPLFRIRPAQEVAQ